MSGQFRRHCCGPSDSSSYLKPGCLKPGCLKRGTLGLGDPLDRENGTELETDLLPETDGTGFEESIADPRISWVWFLPQGQACEATLYLVDQDARRELKVQIHAWSGGVELGRPRLTLKMSRSIH